VDFIDIFVNHTMYCLESIWIKSKHLF